MSITTTESMRSLLILIFVGLVGGAPAALAAPFGKPISSHGELDFTLQGPDERTRRLADFRGKVVAIVFGYTHCPDYCPTTLARLAGVTRQLGKPADFVPIFVTLDPERDTPSVLGAYANAFHPDMVGLRGGPTQTAEAARHFRVLFEKVQEPDGSYSVDHSGGIFLIDRQGRLRLKEPDNLSTKEMAQDIKSLLQEK